MITLKLIGASRFSCRAAGVMDVVSFGETVTVSEDNAKHLLGLNNLNIAGDAKPLFSQDENAEGNYEPAAKEVSLQEAVKPTPAKKKAAPRRRTAKK